MRLLRRAAWSQSSLSAPCMPHLLNSVVDELAFVVPFVRPAAGNCWALAQASGKIGGAFARARSFHLLTLSSVRIVALGVRTECLEFARGPLAGSFL